MVCNLLEDTISVYFGYLAHPHESQVITDLATRNAAVQNKRITDSATMVRGAGIEPARLLDKGF